MEKKINFVIEKETKGTVRYKEQPTGDDPVIDVLYVKKHALPAEYPKALEVTLSW